MPVMYEVNGYDRKTDELKFSVDVPDRRVASVLRTADVPPLDDCLGSYPLDSGHLREIAFLLGIEIDQDDLDFYLEPYETPQKATG